MDMQDVAPVARAPVAPEGEVEETHRSHDAPAPTAPAAEAAPKRSSARRGFTILGIVLSVVLGGIGIYLFVTRNQESTDDAFVDADVVPLAPRVPGQVAEVRVHDNDYVKAGQVLVVLDPSDLKAEVAQAEAAQASARAQVDAARAQEQIAQATAKGGLRTAKAMVSGSSVGVHSAASQVAVAQAAVDRAEAEANKAKADLERTQSLFTTGAVSQQAKDHAQATYDADHAALLQARAQLEAAQQARLAAVSQVAEAQGKLAQSTPVDAQVAAAHAATQLAEAREAQAEAALSLAKLRLSYATIRAPSDGQVSDLDVHAGQLLTVGQPLGQLVPDRTYVTANFKETQIGEMHAGDRAVVSVDAYPGHDFEGAIESLSGGTGARFSLLPPDNASGNFVKVVQRVPVRVRWVKRPDLPMRAGLSVTVTVYTDQHVPTPAKKP